MKRIGSFCRSNDPVTHKTSFSRHYFRNGEVKYGKSLWCRSKQSGEFIDQLDGPLESKHNDSASPLQKSSASTIWFRGEDGGQDRLWKNAVFTEEKKNLNRTVLSFTGANLY